MAALVAPATALSFPVAVDNAQPDHSLILQADEPLVAATPFLQWSPHPAAGQGQPPRMAIPHSRAVKVFLRRCSLSTAQADVQVLSTVNCFQFFLTSDAWERILGELLASNLLVGSPFNAWPNFLSSLEGLQIQQPGSLLLSAADMDLGESFDTPAIPAAAAQPARPARRGEPARPAIPAVDAQPAVPGPTHLAFLSIYTVDMAMMMASSTPLAVWGDLLGALNPGRTRASRLSRLSMAATAAVMIKNAVLVRLMGAADDQATNELVAVNLTDMLIEMRLSPYLMPLVLSEAEIRAELRDSLRAARTDNDRMAVEISRLHYTSIRCLSLSLSTLRMVFDHTLGG